MNLHNHHDVVVGAAPRQWDVYILFSEDVDRMFSSPEDRPKYLLESAWYRRRKGELSTATTETEIRERKRLRQANCLAGALLGFTWYDHDSFWAGIFGADTRGPIPALPVDAFFASDIGQPWPKRMNLDAIKAACREHSVESLNFLVSMGEDYLTCVTPGTRADFGDDGYLLYLGSFEKTDDPRRKHFKR